MSGTTSTLVEICNNLYLKQHYKSNDVINKLQELYENEVDKLYTSTEFKQKEMI